MKLKLFTLITLIPFFATAQYSKLMDFGTTETGAYPYFAEFYFADGYLYGTTTNWGLYNDGTVFKIKTDGSDFVKLLDFQDTITGAVGQSGLVSDGTYLYGITKYQAAYGFGGIYKIKMDGSDFVKIYDFPGEEGGSFPEGKLFYDGEYLFGMSPSGGAFSKGFIYRLKTDGSDFTNIFSFDGPTSGTGPYGALISDGTFLFGMTTYGGLLNQGTAFKVKKDGTSYQKLMDMQDDPNGSLPYGSLVYDGTYLYAMTNIGGEYNYGTIFKILTDGTGYEKLYDFDLTTGAQPLGSLIIDGTTIYGMTELGGPDNNGFAFQIDNDGSNFTHLIDFDGDNGSLPFGSLIKVNGALFGMTNYGGANNTGVIFRYGEEIIEAVNDITKNNITISPNPNSGNFNITVDAADLQNDLKLEIINPLGQTILSQTITSTQTQIHLSQKIPGLYLIKCGSEISTVLVF